MIRMRHFFQTLELFWNTFSRRWNFFAAGFLFLLLAAAPASAQLNLNGFLSGTNGTYYTNFSGMGTANSMWTNQNTHPYLAGWYAAKSVTTTTNIAFNADTGSGTVGGMMNYGSASAADRALGSLNSNPTGDLAFAAYFYNDTGATLTNFTVTYTGEQWRCGGSTTRDILEFGYKKSASALTLQATTNATWGGTLVSSLNYTSPYANATAGACNGNASNKLTLTASLNIDLPSGQYLMLRWRDVNISGNDHGISVDDFVLYFQKVESSAPDVEVKGNGVVISDGDTSPSPSDHTDFGAVGLSQSNLVRTFTITNSGTASMGVGNVSAGGDFTIAAQPSSPVSAGATTTFNVQFDPSASGLRTATISFTNTVSGGKQTYTFDVQGTGVLAGIARSPTTINITAMVGTTNANENFGITNVGRGRLDYNLSSNVNWLSVSPVTGQLAETAGQQTTVKFNLAGLSAGTSNATITINSSGASNDGQTVTVALTLTNIPSIATHAVTNDGKELTRVSWVKLGAFDTMVVYRGTNAPSAPTQGTSYGVGGAVGSDGSHVVYKGSGTNFEHVAGTGRTHYYAFYAITNNHYSLAVTGSVATASYGAGEMVDQAAYTNATILHGLAGGAGWTNAWIESNSGSFSNQTTSFSTQTNYPATAANKLLVPPPSDTGRYAYRQFAGFTAGRCTPGT
jgi:hypothetical protein